MLKLKEKIEQEFGTINKFVETVYNKTNISRTHLYKLINNDQDTNPTMETMVELSRITNIPLEEIIHEYSNRYRNARIEDQRQD